MFEIIKNKRNTVHAYQLGKNSEMIQKLMEEGKIKYLGEGIYEVFSQEAVKSGHGGEKVNEGDYIKIDGSGYPYPNKKAFFEANHRLADCADGNTYEQIAVPLKAWDANCQMCPEIQYLIDHKGLKIDEDSFEHRYSAPLWGTKEIADADAVIVFYSVTRDEEGTVIDVDFNFVARDEFERSYSIV